MPVRKVDVNVFKVDKKLGLVFGYAIVCKVKNAEGAFEPYYDSGSYDADRDEVFADHITETAMLEGVTDFMKSARVTTEMHNYDAEDEPVQDGIVVHSFPMTEDIASALGIEVQKTGWLVAMQPTAAVFKKFESGALKQFSIGGRCARRKVTA